MELQEDVWSRLVKPGIVSPDMIFKAMSLDELFQQEWAERKHGHVPTPEEHAEIWGGAGSEQCKPVGSTTY